MDVATQAWNNFMFRSEPEAHEKGSKRWAAAITAQFMGQVNNGGMNSFLTYSWDLDPTEVVKALSAIGAERAAKQLASVLKGLGVALVPATAEERWEIIRHCWRDELEEYENFSDDTESELMAALETHVRMDESFYLTLRA